MTTRTRRGRSSARRAVGLLVWAFLVSAPHAQDSLLINDQSGGQIEVESASDLAIYGFAGTVAVRTAGEGELRYEIRSLDSLREPRELGLWVTGTSYQLAPLDGSSTERLLVEIAVPPGLDVSIEMTDSNIQVNGLKSSIDIRGSKLDIDGRGVYGFVTIEADDSSIKMDGIEGDLDVAGSKLRLNVARVLSDARLMLQESEATLTEISGEADLDLENTVFFGTTFTGGLRAEAVGGRLRIENPSRRTELILEEAPVEIDGATGLVSIDTDSEVGLSNVKANVTLTGFGARVRGTSSTAPLEITLDDAQVVLDDWQGTVVVTGDRLDLTFRKLTGAVTATTTSSNVTIDTIEGPVNIENDFGDVNVANVKGAVVIVNVDGITQATAVSGSLEARGSGERIEVSWAEVSQDGNQVVHNETGEVWLQIPVRARCRVEARSEYGVVTSELKGIKVSDDDRYASGAMGGASQPVIQVRSSGDIRLTRFGPPDPVQ